MGVEMNSNIENLLASAGFQSIATEQVKPVEKLLDTSVQNDDDTIEGKHPQNFSKEEENSAKYGPEATEKLIEPQTVSENLQRDPNHELKIVQDCNLPEESKEGEPAETEQATEKV